MPEIAQIDPNTQPIDLQTGKLTRQGFQLFAALTAYQLPRYTVSTLPSPANPGRLIYVTNETGGAQPAFSDGTNWRRFTDRAIVS
jgi:hypothetical protein